MKAVLFHKHGGFEVLEYTDFPTPELDPGQVLVRLKAAALNRLDLWVREGWPGIKLEYRISQVQTGLEKWRLWAPGSNAGKLAIAL
jgi:NADPH:quinone reductase-like Zn-dependent oxidoreductase